MKIYIGTSGYSYSYWRNRFYPEKLPVSEWLAYYAIHFNTLELNGSFYRFPRVAPLQKAAASTPDDFMFSVKAHKIITHTRRMKDVKEKIREFVAVVTEGLADKLACILYQMPPSYRFTEERLEDLINNLPRVPRSVIEFRHSSWWMNEMIAALRAAELSFCSVSFPTLPDENIITSHLFYKRMHGVPKLFESSYSQGELDELSRRIPQARECYIYFNNTTFEAGYSNADYLRSIIE